MLSKQQSFNFWKRLSFFLINSTGCQRSRASNLCLLGLFKNATGCGSDPPKVVHFCRIHHKCSNIFGESIQHNSQYIFFEDGNTNITLNIENVWIQIKVMLLHK